MIERRLKEYWCQEKLEFCRPDEIHQEATMILEKKMRHVLSPDIVKIIYEAKIRLGKFAIWLYENQLCS